MTLSVVDCWFMDAPFTLQALDEFALANLFHKPNTKVEQENFESYPQENHGARGTPCRGCSQPLVAPPPTIPPMPLSGG
jgi:hypothetical protein